MIAPWLTVGPLELRPKFIVKLREGAEIGMARTTVKVVRVFVRSVPGVMVISCWFMSFLVIVVKVVVAWSMV